MPPKMMPKVYPATKRRGWPTLLALEADLDLQADAGKGCAHPSDLSYCRVGPICGDVR
jgi:hypothetical protein